MSKKNFYLIKKLSNLTKNIDVCLLIVIPIDKHAFFEPTNFFCKNSLKPSFAYDGTLLSCKKSEKINDLIFHKVQKTRFLAVFCPPIFFFENRAPSHSRVYSFASLCKKSEKTNEPIMRKANNEQTNERTKVNL
eukprot:TCONS_00019951-protein